MAKQLFALQATGNQGEALIAVFEEEELPRPNTIFTGRCCRLTTGCAATGKLVGVNVFVLEQIHNCFSTLPEGPRLVPQFLVTTVEEGLAKYLKWRPQADEENKTLLRPLFLFF